MHTLVTDLSEDTIKWNLWQGQYLTLGQLLEIIPSYKDKFRRLLTDHWDRFTTAKGSSNNHQAWEGGYLDHVVETMNIAVQLYITFVDKGRGNRAVPFSLGDALAVMFLHDLEKPWKHGDQNTQIQGINGLNGLFLKDVNLKSKQARKDFRAALIQQYGITLSAEQENALKYVEGVPDIEYTPGERTMGELAAFCHCCDIMSARLWHDKGQTQEW